MKILVLGKDGQLGQSLQKTFKNNKANTLFSKEDLDISDYKNLKKKITQINPDVLINASAFTQVDDAEIYKQDAKKINQIAPGHIANLCKSLDILLIHISTDYVFNGELKRPYTEEDETNPINHYGLTKLNGERSIINSNCKYIIIRTSWVYSEFGKNFLKTMYNMHDQNKELNIINDQVGCPTYAIHISEAIFKIINNQNLEKSVGVYNFCGDTSISWMDFAKLIYKYINKDKTISRNKILGIKSSDYNSRAIRPKYSVLDCKKIQDTFNINQSSLMIGIEKSIETIKYND